MSDAITLLLVFLTVLNGIVGAVALGGVMAIIRSHNHVHERLKHPFHLHGPVK